MSVDSMILWRYPRILTVVLLRSLLLGPATGLMWSVSYGKHEPGRKRAACRRPHRKLSYGQGFVRLVFRPPNFAVLASPSTCMTLVLYAIMPQLTLSAMVNLMITWLESSAWSRRGIGRSDFGTSPLVGYCLFAKLVSYLLCASFQRTYWFELGWSSSSSSSRNPLFISWFRFESLGSCRDLESRLGQMTKTGFSELFHSPSYIAWVQCAQKKY